MSWRLRVVVPVLVLLVAVAIVIPGCGGGGVPEVWVEGLYRIWAPQLFPEGMMGPDAQQVSTQDGWGNPEEPIALADAYVVFEDDGDAYFEGTIADQTDLADVQTQGWWWGFELYGYWEQDGNLVYAEFFEDQGAQVPEGVNPRQYYEDYAEMNLEFSNNDQASGQLYLELGWWGWQGALALQKDQEFD